MGRLIEKKGFADLLAACALLRERGVEFRCEIIGEGPLRETLVAQAVEGVEFLGARSQAEITERLAAAHLFALPCTTETDGGMDNLPTVIMEAMAAGLPVVSTPLAGVPEMVLPDATGLLVPDRNPPALADALASLLANPERARALGAAGRERAAEKFSLERNVAALAEILARG